jgi:predicted transposase
VKLTIQLKLLPTSDQADALTRTLVTANAACDYISQVAWERRTFGKFALQKLCYQEVRETFGLTAQMVIRALSKVGDSYKLDTKTKRTFRPTSAIAYDDRILSFAMPDSSVSIWTVDKRQSIPFVCGERQRATLHSWSFVQLQAFMAYKAQRAGVPVHRVDPRNTSRTCPKCGHIAKANRKTQSSAAENIRVLGRALVSAPCCSDADGIGSARAKP